MSGVDSPQRRDSFLNTTYAPSGSSSSRSHSPLPSETNSLGGKSRRKLSLFRTGKGGGGARSPSPLVSPENDIDLDDEDEWLIEGGTMNGRVDPDASMGREASTLSRSVDTLSLDDGRAAAPVQPPKPRSEGRGKRLVKKTSRLFGRNGHKDDEAPAPGPGGMLPIPQTGRQSSVSSTGSNETGASRNKWKGLGRVHSRGSPPNRRSSGEAQQPSAWNNNYNTAPLGRTSSVSSSSIIAPDEPVNVPTLRNRSSVSQLKSAATPAPVVAVQPPTQPPRDGGRITSWFTGLMSGDQSGSPSSQHEQSGSGSASPLRNRPSVLSALRNKAVGGLRSIIDSDAQPDHCQDSMWVMGVAHPGWTPPSDDLDASSTTASSDVASPPWAARLKEGAPAQQTPSPPSKLSAFFGSSFNLAAQAEGPVNMLPDAAARYRKTTSDNKPKEGLKWPEQFYDDFRSRVWCTYRSNYAPILPLQQDTLLPNPEAYFGAFATSDAPQQPLGQPQARTSYGGAFGLLRGEGGLTSDSGWGCMLRTGQSMLANALIRVHLGRDWRLPSTRPKLHPETPHELAELDSYATHMRILSWFLDDPSPLCPFSVHRMALIGKELGKEVGEWFGPSTAAGALKTLANSFPICGVSVATAVDSIIYKSDVYAASNTSSDGWDPSAPRHSRPSSVHKTTWGGQAVLILIGMRLGLENVNPIYYDSIKDLFTWPQSVGIAGGRPSSSYYFVASQAQSLFYLDPHHTRATVPLRVPPLSAATSDRPTARKFSASESSRTGDSFDYERDDETESRSEMSVGTSNSSMSVPAVDVTDMDHGKPRRSHHLRRLTATQQSLTETPSRPASPGSPTTPTLSAARSSWTGDLSSPTPSGRQHASNRGSTASSFRGSLPVDPQTAWYASAYPEDKLRSFHCDRVKKLPLSGLDPSMLLGFLVQSEADYNDFCERVARLPQTIFSVQDELPMWSEDEDGALESMSESFSAADDDDGGDDDDDTSPLSGDDKVEVDEFGRMGSTTAPSAAYPAHPLKGAQRGVASLASTRPNSFLSETVMSSTTGDDLSFDLSDDENRHVMSAKTAIAARPSLATLPRNNSSMSDVMTVRGHLRGASTSAVVGQNRATPMSHARGASTSATITPPRQPSSLAPRSRTNSGSNDSALGGSQPPSPFGPSPVVTARRPPPVALPGASGSSEDCILPPPRRASLGAPTRAKVDADSAADAGEGDGADAEGDTTEELRPSLDKDADDDDTETLEVVDTPSPSDAVHDKGGPLGVDVKEVGGEDVGDGSDEELSEVEVVPRAEHDAEHDDERAVEPAHDDTAAASAPADTAPVDTAHANNGPADSAPADTAPADAALANAAPTSTAPTAAPSNTTPLSTDTDTAPAPAS